MGRPLIQVTALLAIVLATGPLFTSCAAGEAASHNLDALLDGNNELRHVVPMRLNPRRGFRTKGDEFDDFPLYAWSIGLGGLLILADGMEDDHSHNSTSLEDGDLGAAGVVLVLSGIFGATKDVVDFLWGGALLMLSSVDESKPQSVHDPSLESLHQLLYLLDAPHDSLATELRLIRQLSRYAVFCPGRLGRERALLGMGPWLAKLSVQSPLDPPRVPLEASDVSALLRAFGDAWAKAPHDGLTGLEGASLDLLDAEIDMEGLWRVLKGLETLAEKNRANEEMKPLMLELARALEGRALALALGAGLIDPDPLVRAAAMEAGMRNLGYSFIQEALESLTPSRTDQQGRVQRTRTHGLLPIVPGEGLVVQRVLNQLAELGLRLPQETAPDLAETVRRRVIGLVIAISYDVVSFDESSRTAALRALGALAPEGPNSRRKEEWEAWWREFASQSAAQPQESSPAQEGATASNG